MSKQRAIAAFNAVEQRIAKRGDFYTDEGRTARMLTCSQLAYELDKGSFASFQRMWSRIQQGANWEAAEDALGEVFDELGLTDIDHLYRFVTTA
jgi:hypothetical protein